MNIVVAFVVGILTGRYVFELLDMFIQVVNANLSKYVTKINKDIYIISQEMEGEAEIDTFAVGFQDTSGDVEEEFWDDEEEFEDKGKKK